MELLRDLGAAITFGLATTTKHKEAEAKHTTRQRQHNQHLDNYRMIQEQIRSTVDAMDVQFAAAQEALLSTGTLITDIENNVIYGWYKPREGVGNVKNNPDYARSATGAIPAFGVGIGTPAAIWTVVGIYGTAATGTAIGTLSGAAAGAATAAWIGRAATLGLGGMTAGRIALGPIGLAASLLTLPIGAAVAGNRERNYIRETGEADGKMNDLEETLGQFHRQATPLQPQMSAVTADMQKHTGQLETAAPNTPEAQDAASKLDTDMRKATALKNEVGGIIKQRDNALKSSGFIDPTQDPSA